MCKHHVSWPYIGGVLFPPTTTTTTRRANVSRHPFSFWGVSFSLSPSLPLPSNISLFLQVFLLSPLLPPLFFPFAPSLSLSLSLEAVCLYHQQTALPCALAVFRQSSKKYQVRREREREIKNFKLFPSPRVNFIEFLSLSFPLSLSLSVFIDKSVGWLRLSLSLSLSA